MPASIRSVTPFTEYYNGATSVIPMPAGTADNDGLQLVFDTLASGASSPTHNTPAGWALRGSTTYTLIGGTYTGRISVFTKVAASEGSDVTVTFEDVAIVTAQLTAIRDIDPAAFFDSIGSFVTGTGSAAMTLPATTVVNAGALLVGIARCDGGGAGATATSAVLTEFDDTNAMWGGAAIQASSGSSGTKLVTADASGSFVGVLVAYKSAAGGSPATLSSPTATSITSSGATIGATTDQSTGTLYTAVSTSNNVAGASDSQIKAGQNSTGASATASGNSTVSNTTPSIPITGLAASTLHYYSIIQNNGNGDSNRQSGSFTTSGSSQGPRTIHLFNQMGASVLPHDAASKIAAASMLAAGVKTRRQLLLSLPVWPLIFKG